MVTFLEARVSTTRHSRAPYLVHEVDIPATIQPKTVKKGRPFNEDGFHDISFLPTAYVDKISVCCQLFVLFMCCLMLQSTIFLLPVNGGGL